MKYIILILIVMCASSGNAAASNYHEWLSDISREHPANALFIPKHTIVCNSRDQMVQQWNMLIANNGNWTERSVKSIWGCSITQGWSIGRLAGPFFGSRIVQIEYQKPYSQKAVKRWTHTNMIMTFEEYLSQIEK